MPKANYLMLFILTIQMTLISCQKDYLQKAEVPKPKQPQETLSLEASYVNSPPKSTSSSYWRTADFLNVSLTDISIENTHAEDGLLNMTGTHGGLTDFNNKGDESLKMKAAYDDENLYIFIEWTDFEKDPFQASWFYDGESDIHKPDSSQSWTSQRNDDKVSLVFNALSASGSSGTFKESGCAVTCHSNMKKTLNGKVDLWKWSLFESEPFGYAINMTVDNSGIIKRDDNGPNIKRNAIDTSSFRSGPQYEWNGIRQEITNASGEAVVLDPSYYLLNKTDFLGDPEIGYTIYMNHDKGCYGCHGEKGDGKGEFGSAPAFTNQSFNAYSRETFDERALSAFHTGRTYYEKVKESEKDDLIARIRAFAGVPGYYIDNDVITERDIVTNSNITLAKIDKRNTQYQIVMVRKLVNGNAEDIQFDLAISNEYQFGVALMDADTKNHIGSLLESITFLPK